MKYFDYDEFMDTVDDCDVCVVVDEIMNWMEDLDLDNEHDIIRYKVLNDVMDVIINSCTYR